MNLFSTQPQFRAHFIVDRHGAIPNRETKDEFEGGLVI